MNRNIFSGGLTVGQLIRAMEKHPYLIMTTKLGKRYAVNSKIRNTKEIADMDEGQITVVVSWKPVSFHEYLSKKLPFI